MRGGNCKQIVKLHKFYSQNSKKVANNGGEGYF